MAPNFESPAPNTDTLSLLNLHLDTGLVAPYVFGARKLQPATVSLTLSLTPGFSSAASTDALDQNTVHYGNLARAIRDGRPEGQSLAEFAGWVEGKVGGLAGRGDGSSRVGAFVVCVRLAKANVAGEGVEVFWERGGGGERRCRVRCVGVRVMVLIGVNAIERTARQPLEVDLEVVCTGEEVLGRDVEAFGLEREMVEIIEPTTFETLESLGEHVVEHLRPKIRAALPSCYQMSLTMRKPKAVAFAEAPVVTLTRAVTQAGGSEGLRLIKPYV